MRQHPAHPGDPRKGASGRRSQRGFSVGERTADARRRQSRDAGGAELALALDRRGPRARRIAPKVSAQDAEADRLQALDLVWRVDALGGPQEAVGNQTVLRLVASRVSAQRGWSVTAPRDAPEAETDAIADAVVGPTAEGASAPAPPPVAPPVPDEVALVAIPEPNWVALVQSIGA